MVPSIAKRPLIVASAVPGTFPRERNRAVQPEVLLISEECAACHVHWVPGYGTDGLMQHIL